MDHNSLDNSGMHAPVVSVIIPTYNRAKECLNSVHSVLGQTYGNIEILIIDDGSTDETSELLFRFDHRIKYIRQENSGVSAARNTGLAAATGDYIAFLDSDDTWLPWKIEAQLSVFDSYPQVGMVWTDMHAIDKYGNIISESYIEKMYGAYQFFVRDQHFSNHVALDQIWGNCPLALKDRICYSGNIFQWMFMGNLVHTSTVLMRRDRQQAVGLFDTQLVKSGEDYDFHFRTCRLGDVAYIDVSSINYRIGAEDQLTEKKYLIWIARNNLRTLDKMITMAKDDIKLPPNLITQRMAWAYAWIGYCEFENHNKQQARSYFWQSLKINARQCKVLAFLCFTFCPEPVLDTLKYVKDIMELLIGL